MWLSVPVFIVGCVASALFVLPWFSAHTDIARLPVIAGIVAWRAVCTWGLVLCTVLLTTSLIFRQFRRFARSLLIPVASAASIMVVTLMHGAEPQQGSENNVTSSLTVMSWNTNGSLVDAQTIAAETLRHHPDVLVLPSINSDVVQLLAAALQPAGYVMARPQDSLTAIFTTEQHTMLPSGRHATYSKSAATIQLSNGMPRVVAVHLPIPLLSDGNAEWNRAVTALGELCESDGPTIIVGDVNSTVDNFAGTGLAQCENAGAVMGKQYEGTWPTSLPATLGIPIDHVFVHGGGWKITDFTVLSSQDESGARHRPVLATLGVSE
ncbi:endonuclease/exonuclease/phosphatase family protein [Timonella sp. A28]|uniref:endonuclease/exonuclease/phosphatase family protein n=1 Tax=Timonella sp. A28 TaxID=3442640 RepID=UPI003EB7D4E7